MKCGSHFALIYEMWFTFYSNMCKLYRAEWRIDQLQKTSKKLCWAKWSTGCKIKLPMMSRLLRWCSSFQVSWGTWQGGVRPGVSLQPYHQTWLGNSPPHWGVSTSIRLSPAASINLLLNVYENKTLNQIKHVSYLTGLRYCDVNCYLHNKKFEMTFIRHNPLWNLWVNK